MGAASLEEAELAMIYPAGGSCPKQMKRAVNGSYGNGSTVTMTGLGVGGGGVTLGGHGGTLILCSRRQRPLEAPACSQWAVKHVCFPAAVSKSRFGKVVLIFFPSQLLQRVFLFV